MISAVLFDLDDTLYPQAAWLEGAWAAVAARGATLGIGEAELLAALHAVAALGTDRGRIIDRALERCGLGVAVAPLAETFRAHAPAVLDCYPGVVEELRAVSALVPVGIVTDGDPVIQRAKVRALSLDHVDVVVYSDENGREHRKPDPLPFFNALDALEVDASVAVFVGDRPDKDIAGAIAAGMRAVRVHTGEYASQPDAPAPWRSVATAVDAVQLLRNEMSARGAATLQPG